MGIAHISLHIGSSWRKDRAKGKSDVLPRFRRPLTWAMLLEGNQGPQWQEDTSSGWEHRCRILYYAGRQKYGRTTED